MTVSNLSKIKPSLRTKGNITGNFSRPKVKAGYNQELGVTDKDIVIVTKQSDYINRMYKAMDTTTDPKLKKFCYTEIKKYLIQTNQWKAN